MYADFWYIHLRTLFELRESIKFLEYIQTLFSLVSECIEITKQFIECILIDIKKLILLFFVVSVYFFILFYPNPYISFRSLVYRIINKIYLKFI